MHNTLPLLKNSDFPTIHRQKIDTLQINIGLRCNQQCVHCHVNASPKRTEKMHPETIELVLDYLKNARIETLDITGGAPELHPQFRELVTKAKQLSIKVIDRCNLTILSEPGQQGLAEFLAKQGVEIIASLPCYIKKNVDKQRGKGVFDLSIKGLQKLNQLGYGKPDSKLVLNLVYNPQGAALPPSQKSLQESYRAILKKEYDIDFNELYVLCNMPINRFGSTLVSKGTFHSYIAMLKNAHQDENLDNVMCKYLISIDWQGYVYDCDFNQMLGLGIRKNNKKPLHISELIKYDLNSNPITVFDHCYGCTAGQGSSCGGALNLQ